MPLLAGVRKCLLNGGNRGDLILHDSFNRADGMPGTPDYGAAYDFTDIHTVGFQALTIVSNQLTFGYNIAGGSNYGALPVVAQANARLEATVVTPGVSDASNNKLYFFIRGGDIVAAGDIMGYILEWHSTGIKLYHYYLPDYNFDLVADPGVNAAPGDSVIYQALDSNIIVQRNGSTIINASGIGETDKVLAGAIIVTDGLGTTPYAKIDELYVRKV